MSETGKNDKTLTVRDLEAVKQKAAAEIEEILRDLSDTAVSAGAHLSSVEVILLPRDEIGPFTGSIITVWIRLGI